VSDEEATLLGGDKALVTIGAMLAGFMAFLDISIVNVALNDIRATFGTPLEQIAWVSTAYAMANITIIPLSGWLLERFGYRRYYATSILIFTAASVLCGLSWNLTSLVVFRVLQGLGGGAIIPTSQSVLFGRWPSHQHGMAGALFGLGAITGPLLGPSIGGWLVEWSSWHLIFLVNLPVGLFCAWVAARKLEEPGFTPKRAPVDIAGIALLAAGMVSLQYVLEEGNRHQWFESSLIVVLALVAVVALVGFVVHELETPHPVVDLRVFANRTYASATAVNFLVGTSVFGGSLLLSLYCGTIMRYRALDIGRVFLLGNWIQIFIFPLAGRLVTRVDPRWLLVLSNAAISTSLWLNAHLTNTADMGTIVTPVMIRGIGIGIGFVPLTFLAVSALPEARRPGGTALFNLTRELGASIGTAWMSTMLERGARRASETISSHVQEGTPALIEQQAIAVRGLAATVDPQAASLVLLQKRIAAQALLRAFNDNFRVLALAFVSATVLILFMRRPGRSAVVDTNAAH
jgi:DHA2 family multidrug resistance protein